MARLVKIKTAEIIENINLPFCHHMTTFAIIYRDFDQRKSFRNIFFGIFVVFLHQTQPNNPTTKHTTIKVKMSDPY